MSIHCTRRVWQHANQDSQALVLRLAIADHAGDDGLVLLRLEPLATRAHLTVSRTLTLLARLQDARELLVFEHPGPESLYLVLPGAGRDLLAAALDRAASLGATIPPGTLERTLDRISAARPQPVTTSRGTPVPPSRAADSPVSLAPSPTTPASSGGDPWPEILDALRLQMDPATFDHCLLGSRAIRVDGEWLTVQPRKACALPWLENRLAPVIARTLAHYLPGTKVRFVAPGTAPPEPAPRARAPRDALPAPPPTPRPSRPTPGRSIIVSVKNPQPV